jgi:hypothetical protein
MVLVVILVVAWLVILGPTVFRRRSEHGDGVSSISHFHHQLSVLEHSRGVPIVTPAFRLQSVAGQPAPAEMNAGDVSSRPVLTVVGAKQLPRPALAFLGEELPSGEPAYRQPPYPATTPRPNNPESRLVARRRRRDTLAGLVLVFSLSLLIGSIPGAEAAWVVTAISAVALVAYVAMLIHMQATVAEGERKLHYLRPDAMQVATHDGYDAVGAVQYGDSRYEHLGGRAAAR